MEGQSERSNWPTPKTHLTPSWISIQMTTSTDQMVFLISTTLIPSLVSPVLVAQKSHLGQSYLTDMTETIH